MSRDAAEYDKAALSKAKLAEILLEIGSLSRSDLQERWRQHFGAPAPAHLSRELMVLALSYAIQANATDGLSADEWKALGMIAHGHTGRTHGAAQDSDEPTTSRARPRPIRRSIKPGTRLLREWQGCTHEVIADADGGFIYEGEPYRSLSAIARQITGTRWSGPAFFGVQSSGQLAKTKDGNLTGDRQ